ncbi:hypothetical protein AB0G35_07985 [Streptomyces sp. NPDC021749]|uniref:hypothetical protein n=1 Tax=Streptomyces sp. NPDC021749 TaxID=3154905 RepID=UPI0033E42329
MAAVQVIGELVTCACLFTPSDSVYLSLRYRDDALRVNLHDGHPPHAHRRLAAACEARRRSVLLLLAGVMRACDGTWGIGAPPGTGTGTGEGTRRWAVLPRAGARAYGQEA